MKIAILTHPLVSNYGGILQAYALQKVLKNMGHEVVTVNRRNRKTTLLRTQLQKLKQAVFKHHSSLILTNKQKEAITINSSDFIKRNINLSELLDNTKKLKHFFKIHDFDAVIVGSDQIWRPPPFTYDIYNSYLDFLEDNKKIKRISYAASFGTEDWEYNNDETKRCAELIQNFDAVSVREDSGVQLCKKYLNKKALHHIDPSMLLKQSDYIKLFEQLRTKSKKGNLYTYILDTTDSKKKIINLIANKYNFKEYFSQPIKSVNNSAKDSFVLEDFIFPSVEEWIKGFYDADFVVTDSFHGTVFSILFNIPFITIANKRRGITRFTSLLKMFKLEDRLILDFDEVQINKILQSEINWDRVSNILDNERNKAMSYLKFNLQ